MPSSPQAFVCSLRRRRDQLERVVRREATDQFLDDDGTSSADLDDLEDVGDVPDRLPSSLPATAAGAM